MAKKLKEKGDSLILDKPGDKMDGRIGKIILVGMDKNSYMLEFSDPTKEKGKSTRWANLLQVKEL